MYMSHICCFHTGFQLGWSDLCMAVLKFKSDNEFKNYGVFSHDLKAAGKSFEIWK